MSCLFPSTLCLITAPTANRERSHQNQIHLSSSNRHWQTYYILRLFVSFWLVEFKFWFTLAAPEIELLHKPEDGLWILSCRQTDRQKIERAIGQRMGKTVRNSMEKRNTQKVDVHVFSIYSGYLKLFRFYSLRMRSQYNTDSTGPHGVM